MIVHTGYLSHVTTHNNNNKEIIMSSVIGDTQGRCLWAPYGALGVSVRCGEWNQMASKGPFQLKPFCGSTILWKPESQGSLSSVVVVIQPARKYLLGYILWKYQGFGGTNPLTFAVLHLLWTVQSHTGSFYSFSTRTTAPLLHFLIGKKVDFFFFLPKCSSKSLVCWQN